MNCYVNYYRCDHAGRPAFGQSPAAWSAFSESTNNAHCPVCHREREPVNSEELPADFTAETTLHLTVREVAAVLHGLRCYQESISPQGISGGCIVGPREGSCDHFEEVEPLTAEEIDKLCESINMPAEIPLAPSNAEQEAKVWKLALQVVLKNFNNVYDLEGARNVAERLLREGKDATGKVTVS